MAFPNSVIGLGIYLATIDSLNISGLWNTHN